MRGFTVSAGSYPRVGEGPRQQRLRHAHAQFETGAIAETSFRAIEDEVASEVIAEQTAIGIDVVTDGLVRWYDPVSHTGRKLAGVTINGLLRFFDNNFYFRQPVIRDRISRVSPIVAAEYRFATRCSTRPVKAVLTGPYTLARHSLLATSIYRDHNALTLAYADVLAAEVGELVTAGARYIQLDEPSILRAPADLPLLADALAPIVHAKGAAELTLATYFGDATAVFDGLVELPIEVLHIDLVTNPHLAERLAATDSPKRLALGVLDGRNTRLEEAGAVVQMVEAILEAASSDSFYLTTSCGLEFLPRPHARRKLERLVEVGRALSGGYS